MSLFKNYKNLGSQMLLVILIFFFFYILEFQIKFFIIACKTRSQEQHGRGAYSRI